MCDKKLFVVLIILTFLLLGCTQVPIEEMKVCEVDDDCVNVGCECGGKGDVINKKYIGVWEAQNNPHGTLACSLMECLPTKISCENRVCVSTPRDLRTCNVDNDCIVVEGKGCCACPEAINKNYLNYWTNLVDDYYTENCQGIMCDIYCPIKNYGAVCEFNECKVIDTIGPEKDYKFEVREWGVLAGCLESDEFFLTSRPENVMLEKLPIIYFTSENVDWFGLNVVFQKENSEPTITYPETKINGKSVNWKNVKIKDCEESKAVVGAIGEGVNGFEEPRPLEEMLSELNNVDSDCLKVGEEESRFLFYEGEVTFESNIDFTFDMNKFILYIKNNNDYPIYNILFSSKGGKRAFIEELSPGEEEIVSVSQAYQYNNFNLTERMKDLGFSEMEANSFNQIWNYSFFNSNDEGRLSYLLPQSEFEKISKLRFTNVSPTKTTRALWVLNNIECPKNCGEINFEEKAFDVNKLKLSFEEIKTILDDDTLLEENFGVIVSDGSESIFDDLNALLTETLVLDKTNFLDHLFINVFSFNSENAAQQYYYLYSAKSKQSIFDHDGLDPLDFEIGDESVLYSFSDIAGDEELFGRLYHKKAYVREEGLVITVELQKRNGDSYSNEKIKALIESIFEKIS